MLLTLKQSPTSSGLQRARFMHLLLLLLLLLPLLPPPPPPPLLRE
jgi:hypothetical protein